jgi:hypothetical protein
MPLALASMPEPKPSKKPRAEADPLKKKWTRLDQFPTSFPGGTRRNYKPDAATERHHEDFLDIIRRDIRKQTKLVQQLQRSNNRGLPAAKQKLRDLEYSLECNSDWIPPEERRPDYDQTMEWLGSEWHPSHVAYMKRRALNKFTNT